jgi:hypothetical protein
LWVLYHIRGERRKCKQSRDRPKKKVVEEKKVEKRSGSSMTRIVWEKFRKFE